MKVIVINTYLSGVFGKLNKKLYCNIWHSILIYNIYTGMCIAYIVCVCIYSMTYSINIAYYTILLIYRYDITFHLSMKGLSCILK